MQNLIYRLFGINEDEFVEYLSIAGYIANSHEYTDMLNLSTRFIDTLYSSYEPEILESGEKKYDIDIINNVLKEIIGDYIKEDIENNDYYTFDKQTNTCTKLHELDEIPYCIEIENIEKLDNGIEIKYKLAIMTNSQKVDFLTTGKNNAETINVKATISNNTEYAYSKYFISNIEVNN